MTLADALKPLHYRYRYVGLERTRLPLGLGALMLRTSRLTGRVLALRGGADLGAAHAPRAGRAAAVRYPGAGRAAADRGCPVIALCALIVVIGGIVALAEIWRGDR